MRALTPLLCLAAALTAAGPLRAEEQLPEHTLRSTGAPPLVPDVVGEHLPRWIDTCVAAGRRQVGTRAGGDLLYSAGAALARDPEQRERALGVLGEAAAAYPTGAPFRGLVLLTSAELRLAAGDATAARDLLDAAEATARRRVPGDASAVDRSRHDVLIQRIQLQGPRLGVRIDESAGDLASAAERQERFAAQREGRDGPDATARAWARAARLRARQGDAQRALAAVDRALELVDDDVTRTDLRFWRLHLLHGLLDAEGAPALGTHWPGDAFVTELHATLRGLQGAPGVGTWLLTLASRAVTAGRDDVALDLYQLALRDPMLLDRARDDPGLWGGLLVAFPVALRLGRLGEAERILDVVAGVATVPREDLDAYRLALGRAREEATRAPAPTGPRAESGVEVEDAASPSPHRGRLLPHGPADRDEHEVASRGGEPLSEVEPAGSPAGLLGAAFAIGGLLLFATLAVRLRRRRASLGGQPPRR